MMMNQKKKLTGRKMKISSVDSAVKGDNLEGRLPEFVFLCQGEERKNEEAKQDY